VEALVAAGVRPDRITFLDYKVGLPWARDAGPLVVKSPRAGYRIVDSIYFNEESDHLPLAVGQEFGFPVDEVPLEVPHGNLLTNGAGFVVTTDRLLLENEWRIPDADNVKAVLSDYYGATQVLILQALASEGTGHADMFVTFPAVDVAVVGQCSAEKFPQDALILDRNAESLKDVDTPMGPMQVVRIPMPSDTKAIRKSYTNVIYANGVLVVPRIDGEDPAVEQQVVAVYRSVLPGWKIVFIDSTTPFHVHGGGPHCLSMNLYRLNP
jgi:agmatine/peptidylarginine deiminase